MKVLLFEDEESIHELIKFNLENEQYRVKGYYNGENALKHIVDFMPDLVLLDIMLPVQDGISIARKMKEEEKTRHIPIIFVTAKGEEVDKLIGLELGADDYVAKPFSIRELLARIKAVLRRTAANNSEQLQKTIEIGNLTIQPEAFEVYRNGQLVDLTLKEYELLMVLYKNKGKVLNRNELLDKVWGYDYFSGTRTVDVHIRNLRKKIEADDANPRYIHTIRGVGYTFKE